LNNSLNPALREKLASFKQNKYVQKMAKINRLFLFAVFIPTSIAIFYFVLVASDVYISESSFVVKNPEQQNSSTSMMAMLGASSNSASPSDAYSVQQFILSRDALKKLIDQQDVKKHYSSTTVDRISRFSGLYWDDSFEAFYKYYLRKVDIQIDMLSSISTLTVRAYSAKEAYQINLNLLEQSEALVNQMNQRARDDIIRFASKDVESAEDIAKKAEIALALYRNKGKIFDPVQQSAINLQLISTLQSELIAAQIQLAQIQKFAKNNPQIPMLEKSIVALKADIESETNHVAGDGRSFSSNSSEIDRLTLERDFANTLLADALKSLEEARSKALRKELYIERIVQPNQPDIAIEPRTALDIIFVFLLSMIVWGILTLFISAVKEHRA